MHAAADKTLYVVFNGLVSLIHRIKPDASEDYLALMVRKEPHKYLAGSWLNEQTVPSGPLQLTGLTGGDQSIDPAENLVIKVAALDLNNPSIHAYVVLPKPVEVYSCYQVDIPDLLTDKTAFVGQSTKLSGVQVFKYFYSTSEDVTLTDSAGNVIWECPNAPRDSEASCSVLHFYDEPFSEGMALAELVTHNLDEFRFTAKLLGKEVGLKSAIERAPAKTTPPSGLLAMELESLGQRENVVRKMTSIALRAPLVAYPISSDPANCTGPDGIFHPGPGPGPSMTSTSM